MAQKHSTKPTDIGKNRTGIASSPVDAKRLVEAAQQGPTSDGGPERIAAWRAELAATAPPQGTMPPPATVKGAAKSVVKALQGERANVLLDKLGERLAFERTGVRLYDAVLAKLPASATAEGELDAADLAHLREEEHRHMLVVAEAIRELGGDPTAMTPCANFAGVQGSGLVQSMTDPRATLTQCLDSLLVAELADNDGWKLLIALAEAMGQSEMAQRFTECLAEEDEHLAKVRRWIRERLSIQAGAELPSTDFGAPAQPA
jgi:ferritin-like protein